MSTNTPHAWAEILNRGVANAADGRIVPFEPVLDRLRASIARMEAKQRRNAGEPAKEIHQEVQS